MIYIIYLVAGGHASGRSDFLEHQWAKRFFLSDFLSATPVAETIFLSTSADPGRLEQLFIYIFDYIFWGAGIIYLIIYLYLNIFFKNPIII